MKNEKIRLYLIETILIIFLLFSIIFRTIINRQMVSIILLVLMGITEILIKNDKTNYTNLKQVIFYMGLFGICYIGILYFLGIFSGFYLSTVRFSLWSIGNYIIPYAVIIISSEIIRKKLLLKSTTKINNIIVLIEMVLIDVILNLNSYNLELASDTFALISFVILSSIANNLLFNYIIVKYRNEKSIILYRMLITIYVYILPIMPDLYIFIESILKMIIPYIIYIILEILYGKKDVIVTGEEKRKEIILTFIACTIAIGLVMLISCKFKFGLLVIGSGSMTGTINKGDIIIYEQHDENNEINVGDIIVFWNDEKKIVHRIIDKKEMGTEVRYYTKGDANQQEDKGYVIEKKIIGKVKIKIPYIGNLTLWANNVFANKE